MSNCCRNQGRQRHACVCGGEFVAALLCGKQLWFLRIPIQQLTLSGNPILRVKFFCRWLPTRSATVWKCRISFPDDSSLGPSLGSVALPAWVLELPSGAFPASRRSSWMRSSDVECLGTTGLCKVTQIVVRDVFRYIRIAKVACQSDLGSVLLMFDKNTRRRCGEGGSEFHTRGAWSRHLAGVLARFRAESWKRSVDRRR